MKLIEAIETKILPSYGAKEHPAWNPHPECWHDQGIKEPVPERCEIQIDRRTLPGKPRPTSWLTFEVVNELTRQDPDFRAVIEAPFLEDSCLETLPSAVIVGVEAVCQSVIGRSQLGRSLCYQCK